MMLGGKSIYAPMTRRSQLDCPTMWRSIAVLSADALASSVVPTRSTRYQESSGSRDGEGDLAQGKTLLGSTLNTASSLAP